MEKLAHLVYIGSRQQLFLDRSSVMRAHIYTYVKRDANSSVRGRSTVRERKHAV